MSEVINPPEYYFPNIDFNPSFYADDTGGLSQETANTLYLRKTVPDTAIALETFTAGIKTPSIASTGTGASNLLNIGVDPRTVAGAIHHYSDGDNCVAGAGVHLNNGLNNNSATNIHNGTGANATGTVNIMSGSANSGTITIGNETTNNTTTTLQGNTTITKPTISRPITFPATFTAPILGQMFFEGRATSPTYTTSTTTRAYAPINGLTRGIYLFIGIVSFEDTAPITRITTSLVYSASAIANEQASGFTVINDNTLEAYGYKSTTGATGGRFTMNLSTVYALRAAPDNNVAIAVSTGVAASGFLADFKYYRLA